MNGKRSPMTRGGGWSIGTKILPLTGGPVVGLQIFYAFGARENEDDLGRKTSPMTTGVVAEPAQSLD